MNQTPAIDILFVDDEDNVLRALQRTMRPKHQEWSMRFASSGAEALRLLEEKPADVVISDMRMPGMDGATLLHKVRALYPTSIRFVLSGHAEENATLRALGAVHRYLSKPCERDRLVLAIDEALSLRKAILSDDILRLLMAAGDLTAPVGAIARLQRVLSDEMADIGAIVDAIRSSDALVARVIQAANSPIVSPGHPVMGLEQAVRLLGVVVLKALALDFFVTSRVDEEVQRALAPFDLGGHASRACELIPALADLLDLSPVEREGAMTTCLLHLIGIGAFCAAAPKGFVLRALMGVEGGPRGLELAIQRFTGIAPQQLGGALLHLWSMPPDLVSGVLGAYEPQASPIAPNRRDAAVHLACVRTALKQMTGQPAPNLHLDIDYLQAALGPDLGLSLEDSRKLVDKDLPRQRGAA